MSASEIVTRFLRLCAAREIDAAVELLAPDVEYDNQPVGAVYGRAAVRAALSEGIMAEADEVDWVVLRQAAEGDLVLNERIDRFRIGVRWLEIPVAGVFELDGPLIRLWRDYFDLDGYRSQRNGT